MTTFTEKEIRERQKAFREDMMILFATVCEDNKGKIGVFTMCPGCKKQMENYIMMHEDAILSELSLYKQTLKDKIEGMKQDIEEIINDKEILPATKSGEINQRVGYNQSLQNILSLL